MHKIIAFIFAFSSWLLIAPASYSQDIQSEFTEHVENETISNRSVTQSNCAGCSSCGITSIGTKLPFSEFPFIIVTVSIFVLLAVKKYKTKVLFWTIGISILGGLVIKMAQSHSVEKNKTEFLAANIESPNQANKIYEPSFNTVQNKFDEFEDSDEFLSVSDNDEFEEFDDFAEFDANEIENNSDQLSDGDNKNLIRTLLALIATILSGFAFRYANSKNLRYAILLASLVYFGFYSSGCPCMIASLQNFILLLLGEPTRWISLIWIVGLLPITYFFGKVWCGWVCHLGALQEFLYRPEKSPRLLSPAVQKAFKIAQYVALSALLIQLIITRTNLFIKIDPFKVAFNLFSANNTGYVLLAVLLISSLLVYRPFCQSLCPVGLILGWIEKIPGASKLKIDSSCKSCKRCVKDCACQAISNTEGNYTIENSDCIRCGDCIKGCSFNTIKSTR